MFCQIRGSTHVLVRYHGITTCPKLWPFSSYCVKQSFHNLKIFLIDCLTFMSIFMVHETLIIKKSALTWHCSNFDVLFLAGEKIHALTPKSNVWFRDYKFWGQILISANLSWTVSTRWYFCPSVSNFEITCKSSAVKIVQTLLLAIPKLISGSRKVNR